jgi:[acyl-carrier-protein] S-malonyltransferase
MSENKFIAIGFPGAGVETTGYEKELYERHADIFNPYFEIINDKLKIDIKQNLLHDKLSKLNDCENQLFTLAFSSGYYSLLKKNNIGADFIAGYSFGIYTALFASSVINYEDSVKISYKAYNLMISVKMDKKTGMCAIIGPKTEEINEHISKNDLNSLKIVNSNNETCKVIAGYDDELQILSDKVIQAGAIKAVKLNVDIAYHHPQILGSISNDFRSFLDEINFNAPEISIISTIDGSILKNAESIKDFICKHLFTPINWEKTALKLFQEHNVVKLIECGPGISLTQNGRFIDSAVKYVNIKNIKRKLGL